MPFPNNPSVGDEYTEYDTKFRYNGVSWDRVTIGSGNRTSYGSGHTLDDYETRIAAIEADYALIDGAPELLNTLNELSAAIGDDENFVTTMTTANATLQSEIDALEAAALAARTAIQDDVNANEATALAARNTLNSNIIANLALLTAQRALEWDAVFATNGSLYATTTTVG